jgi:hypothetical protein
MLIAGEGRCRYSAYIRGGVGDVWQMKALMTLVLVLLLAGCAAGRGNSAGSTTTVQESTTHSAAHEETTVLAGEEELPQPPDSTLSYGGREVTGTLGTYCWDFSSGSSASAGSGCVDMFDVPIPPKQQTLTVPSGSEMVFRYGGQASPNRKTVEAKAYPLNKLHKNAQDVRPPHRSLQAHGSGVERTISAELPPGEYVVGVFFEEEGSADQHQVNYFFRIMVE